MFMWAVDTQKLLTKVLSGKSEGKPKRDFKTTKQNKTVSLEINWALAHAGSWIPGRLHPELAAKH